MEIIRTKEADFNFRGGAKSDFEGEKVFSHFRRTSNLQANIWENPPHQKNLNIVIKSFQNAEYYVTAGYGWHNS